MQASIYRRNYYLIRVNSENKFPSDQNHQREIYSETARVINEMISHIKTLLFRVNSVREELEGFEEEHDDLGEVDDLLEGFREFTRGVPLTFFSQYPLDNQMTGPFVLRLTKEMSYYRKHLPLLAPIINEIDNSFQEQKKSQAENVSLIYFMAVKRVIADSSELFRKMRAKIVEELHQADPEEPEKEPNIFLVPTFRQAHNNESLKKFRDSLGERMAEAIANLYSGLDVVSFEAVDHYITELSPEDNAELLAKKQCRRNKKLKREVKAYRLSYNQFVGKRQRIEEKKRLKRRRPTNIKLSLNKNHLNSIEASNKSLPNRNSKILLPSIKSLGKEMDLIQAPVRKKKLSKKENQRESKFSIDKQKLVVGKYKQHKVHLRLKL